MAGLGWASVRGTNAGLLKKSWFVRRVEAGEPKAAAAAASLELHSSELCDLALTVHLLRGISPSYGATKPKE